MSLGTAIISGEFDILSQRTTALDDVEAVVAYARDMTLFLNESEMVERRALVENFVKGIVVKPVKARIRHTVTVLDNSRCFVLKRLYTPC